MLQDCRFPSISLFLLPLAVGCGGSSTTDVQPDPPAVIYFDAATQGNRDIYSVQLDGSALTRLTTSPSDDAEPTNAGGSIVFVSRRDGNAELYAVSPTGFGERRLTSTAANETSPAAPTDGSRLAYLSDVSGVPRVWIAGREALSGNTPLTGAAFGFNGSIEAHPSWAPSASALALVATANGNAGIYTAVPTAGVTPVRIAAAAGTSSVDVEPSWSPDGTRIVFASTRAGGTELFVVTVAAGATTQLTTGGGSNGQPCWLANGRIVFTQFGTTSMLAWIDPQDPQKVVHAIPLTVENPRNPSR